ncbi:MAG: hypothetical protein V8S58_18400 [Lachnospiraceae bacterium]
MFGPVDFLKLIEIDEHEIATNPNFRWKSMAETHEGALMGGDPATLRERSKEFCPPYILTKEMCPMLILHGDCDKLVPCSISEEFYDKIVEGRYGGPCRSLHSCRRRTWNQRVLPAGDQGDYLCVL